MDEPSEEARDREEKPGLLRRVEATFCTAKVARVVVVIKFIIALVTCVIVFSQIIDSTEYLISHYCMLNYFEKKHLGREDIIDLAADAADITFCHSSIALRFSLEETRVPVNASAGLLAALCLLTCLAAPVALRGLQRGRPALVLSWFVVTAARAAVVTAAAAVFVALGWDRFTALTRHPAALFMTHLGCALLDVLTDLPALMLYCAMTQRKTERQEEEGEDREGEAQATGETRDAVLKESKATAPVVLLSAEVGPNAGGIPMSSDSACGTSFEGECDRDVGPGKCKTSPHDLQTSTEGTQNIASSNKNNPISEKQMKTGYKEDEQRSAKRITSDKHDVAASYSKWSSATGTKQGSSSAAERNVESEPNQTSPSQSTSKTVSKEDIGVQDTSSEELAAGYDASKKTACKQDYDGTVLVFHQA